MKVPLNRSQLVMLGSSLAALCLFFLYSLISADKESEEIHCVKVLASGSPPDAKRAVPSIPHPTVVTPRTLDSPLPPESVNSMGSSTECSQEEILPELPVVYQFDRQKYDTLPPNQQDLLFSLNQEYLQFYQSWNNSYPHDIAAWNRKMEELRSELARSLGNNAADVLR